MEDWRDPGVSSRLPFADYVVRYTIAHLWG